MIRCVREIGQRIGQQGRNLRLRIGQRIGRLFARKGYESGSRMALSIKYKKFDRSFIYKKFAIE